MAFSYACFTLQRVVVPAVLVLAALIRPVGISFVYLLMFFMSPFIPLATRRNFKGSVSAYFIILLALSTLVLLCHIALQVIIATTTLPIDGCTFTVQLLRHVGFINFMNLKPWAIIEWLVPEIFVFAISLATYLTVKKYAAQATAAEQLENGEMDGLRVQTNEDDAAQTTATTAAGSGSVAAEVLSLSRKRVSMISQHMHFDTLIKISPLFCLAALFFAAVLRPSVPGGFYFLIFLLSGTYWATFQTLQRGFALVLRFVMIIIVMHVLCIVSFQTPWLQNHLNATQLEARLLGLEPLILSACVPDIRILQYNTNLGPDSFLNPIALLLSYFAFALTAKHLIKPKTDAIKSATAFGQSLERNNTSSHASNKVSRQLSLLTQASTATRSNRKDSGTKTHRLSVSLHREQRSTEPTETTPLVRQHTRSQHVRSRTPQTVEASGAAAAPPTTSQGNDMQMESMEQRSELENNNTTTIFDQISYGFVSVGGFIYQNSYIFTNILMMAWSIVYHSWLTFVLLLWANVLWMIPNQRKAMMRSSPFIVLYTELLLVAQYIYGMDLNNDELPTKVTTAGINLQQIGFERPKENEMRPCIPLIVKTAFLLMFWITSRQFFKEKSEKRRNSTLADINSPWQITVGLAGSTYLMNDDKKTSKFLKKAGDVIKNLLVRLWIWLLILVIFLCAITGQKMTGFRICYMALFLFFLLVFQSSSKAWVKIMYGFWLFLIFYAMSILILIYTYQFDKFNFYWYMYLNVNESLQSDIGLKQYETKQLFLHLASPTLIVILTVIQVHYFHKRFIASLQQQPTLEKPSETYALEPAATATNAHTNSQRRASAGSLRRSLVPNEATDFETSVRDLVRISFRKIKGKTTYIFKNFKDVFWRFLELHILKAVYLVAFICSVSEISVLHIIFVGLCVIGAISRKSVQVFVSRIISFIVTVIVLLKMVYQITNFDEADYKEICANHLMVNTAEWVGFRKEATVPGGLMALLRTYIIYMVVVTLHAVISLRQLQMRIKTGRRGEVLPKVLFQNITRTDAEKDLVSLTKYLFNYGFYKFGMEISLIALVSTITYRQDIVAVAYAIWLFVLLLLNRSKCAKIWGVLQTFIAISILIQYIVLVGLPPNVMCMEYPWLKEPYGDNIQRWALLPGNLNYNHVPKLIFDFIVLMILNRQKRVFSIELRFGDDYAGGTNRSVISDIANLGRVPFENPTHDFCSYIRNYSDILKNAVLCGFYWITLAVVFLAATNISDLLALGYLCAAFIFLWQGSDFYLRPINTILSRWNLLLTYNVANILIKTCFQMSGCLFMKQLTTNCCWLVHVLGITCASHGHEDLESEDNDMLSGDCPKITHQVVLLWDTICFAFIIFQLRIFKSHYFCHIIMDSKANNILASRGADIIENLRQKQIAHRHEHEKLVLHKIKRKMERIRATQQKLLRPMDRQTHFDGLSTPSEEVSEVAPLLHQSSFAFCQGSIYRTPEGDDADNAQYSATSSEDSADQAVIINQEINIIPCDDQTDYADINSLSNSSEQGAQYLLLPFDTQVDQQRQQVSDNSKTSVELKINLVHDKSATPSTDALSLPTDDFLEPKRISLRSDLMLEPRGGSQEQPQGHKLLSTKLSGKSTGSPVTSVNLTPTLRRQHRRQSSTNAVVSWNENVTIKHSSTPTAASKEDAEVLLRKKTLHRRHLSMGNASYSMGEATMHRRRRSSNISGTREEALLKTTKRPNSWGPVEHGYPLPAPRVQRRKEIKLHPHATRAGDYYMFEEMDDKIELDLIHDEIDFLEEENITESEMKMQRRKTLYDVWKDLNNAEYRRYLYMRERSYASAPGSRIGLKIDEIGTDICDDDDDTIECHMTGVRTSTFSEPLDYVSRLPLTTEESFKSKDPLADLPSTSKGISKEKDVSDLKDISAKDVSESKEVTSKETSDSKSKVEVDSDEVTAKDSDEDFETNPIIRLLEGFLVTLTIRLNRFSRNYRFVNRILAEEKKTLKESNSLSRLGVPNAAAMFHFLKSNLESTENAATLSLNQRNSNNILNHGTDEAITTTILNNNITSTPLQQQQQEHNPNTSQIVHVPEKPTRTTQADDEVIEMPLDTVDAISSRKQSINSSPPAKGRKSECGLPEIRIKAPSIERGSQLHAHTTCSGSLSKHWSCEQVDSAADFNLDEENFVTRDHHIIIEVLISAWYALLANTDLICYIVVFINQVVNASLISLPLPIMVFLWGTLSLPRPTKTFWVTLIAYTKAIVLIKCICQFKLIWVTYHARPNQPLAPAKIFGVEMKPHYAIYDLVLLLVLFLHRYLLKSQGLWKSGYKDVIDQPLKQAGSISDEHEDSDNLSSQDARNGQEHNDSLQKLSLHVSQASLPDSPDYNKSGINQLERTKYLSSLCKFFFSLVHKSRLPTDVYALMFFCDFINFFVLLFGFTAFGTQQAESDGGVQTYLAENKVPVPFLIMLLVQFLLIVIDRALYLRKALKYKIVFHFLSVIGIHIWMFFIVPMVTERSFNSLAPPIIFYIIKCFYMLLSSYQIKSGYPKRILGNFFTKGFSLFNMISFKVYMQIPFLYELRTILDWVCIDSTMTIFDWLKMEDIFSNIYLIRCARQSETDFPAMRAQKKAAATKLLMGGTVVLLIVICIWGPLCLFALGNAVGQSNVPYHVQYSIRIGPYDPIYTTNNYDSVFTFDDKKYADMQNTYIKNRHAITFLTGYDASDVAAVKLAGNSPSLWRISPPDLERLLDDLNNARTLTARFSYSLTRIAPAKGLKDSVSSEIITTINGTFEGLQPLKDMLTHKDNVNKTVVLPAMIPKFIKVLNSGEALSVSVLREKESDTDYRPLVIKMHRDNETNSMWWELRDYCDDSFYTNYLSKLPYSNCTSGIVMYTFNDKKFPSTFSFLTAGGIIGLYTTFVLLASRFMKSFIGGQNRKIMYEDLPYVDRVLQLCLDIYLVREALEFALEEDLFAKLLFLYRSPETMIKWTRPKEEYVDDDGDTDSLPSRMSVRRPEQLQQQHLHQQ